PPCPVGVGQVFVGARQDTSPPPREAGATPEEWRRFSVRELRVALIGGGGFMGRAHSMAYALAPLLDAEARLVRHTLVDVSAELAERAADTYGWQHHSSDWEAVVASDEIDIVDIVTPPQFHL